ncbi:MAG: aminoglycoside phosphotransferase, partial [Bradyrhizobium sp.]|nr:aminoglycoside phosphotransferase [Bradyrhizobium sp.]
MTTNALPPAANADHLTTVLRKACALGDGRVRDVDPENPRETILSHIVRLKLAYDGVAPAAPASLILKTARRDRLDPSWVAGRQEVAFYNQ